MSKTRQTETRRGFLKKAAVAFAAPYMVPASVLGRAGAVPPSEQVTVGKIGCNSRSPQIGACGGRLVAACDVWKQRREQYASNGCKTYNDFRELLARDDIDAVVIATPDHWHVPMAVAAAQAGKDMYVEKPLGMSIEEDLLCRAAIKRYGRIFMYGTQRRQSRLPRFACELVRSGRIGEIREIVVSARGGERSGGNTRPLPVPPELDYDLWLGPAPWRPYTGLPVHKEGRLSVDTSLYGWWYHVYDYCLGFIAGWGAHFLDLLQWGFPTQSAGRIEIEGTGTFPTGGAYDAIAGWKVKMHFENGVRVSFSSGGRGRFVGTEGWVALEGGDAEPQSLLKVELRPDEVHLDQGRAKNFVDAVKTRKPPMADIDDAVRSDILSHLSDIAIRTGRKITWDPVKEEIVGDPEASRYLRRSLREPWRI